MRIHTLKTNHLENPLGHALQPAVFSWVAEAEPHRAPAAFQVQVAADKQFDHILYDSGFRQDLDSRNHVLPLPLKPKTRYHWRVSALLDGTTAASRPAWFETGLMGQTDGAEWIGLPDGFTAHPLFRRSFTLDAAPKKARAYVCGLGLYELWVNGQKVGDEYLAPFYNGYDNWLQLQTYDIGGLLHRGENVIGASLGNGWYKGRFGFPPGMDSLYGDRFMLFCQLEAKLEDGGTFALGTSPSWTCAPSPVLESSIYDGEVYDARLERPGWALPGGDNMGFVPAVALPAPQAPLCDRHSPPLKIIERREAQQLLRTPKGEMVLDFGQMMTGWVEFECALPTGQDVTLEYSEILQDGCFYNENLRSARQAYRYISDGTRRRVRPHFTFYGFRYVRVTGMDTASAADFTGCVLCSVVDRTGHLSTGHSKVNRLIENALWSQKGNFVDVPTDCPQRDERMGWTGDAQVFCPTACFFTDNAAFYHKYLVDLGYEQQRRGGEVPHVVPDILAHVYRQLTPDRDPYVETGGSCAWGDTATIIPWQLYLVYGDKDLLARHYPKMKAWVDYITKIEETRCGGERLWRYGNHFADWLSLDNYDKDSTHGGSDPYFIASAYYHHSALLTAKAAGVLGMAGDAARYHRLAEEVLQAIRREYFTQTGRLAIGTQTGLALALVFGLVPDEHRARACRDLAARLETDHLHLTTGFVGTPCLCPALCEGGYAKYAYSLLLNEDYPSWLYAVNLGATSIWERWNSVLPDGSLNGTGMNSLNHYSYGSIVEWIVQYAAGLNPTEEGPGYRHALIRPYPDQRIGTVNLSYRSASGLYQVGWEMQENKLTTWMHIPFGATAEYHVTHSYHTVAIDGGPAKQTSQDTFMLEQGNHRFAFVLPNVEPSG